MQAAVDKLLARPLTVDSAVQIALLNNRSLQAVFEDLAISQADLVQAGLLHNPVFAASFRLPDRPPNGTDTELSVEQDFLDLMVMPLRRKVAAAEFEHAQLNVADHVVQLADDVKVAVYTIQARLQLVDRLREIADANQTAAGLARWQFDAGTINELGLVNQEATAAQAFGSFHRGAATRSRSRAVKSFDGFELHADRLEHLARVAGAAVSRDSDLGTRDCRTSPTPRSPRGSRRNRVDSASRFHHARLPIFRGCGIRCRYRAHA